jgi:hypothetical protein
MHTVMNGLGVRTSEQESLRRLQMPRSMSAEGRCAAFGSTPLRISSLTEYQSSNVYELRARDVRLSGAC